MERRPAPLERWPTGAVLLLLLTAALLPLGLVLAWAAQQNIREAKQAQLDRADQQGVAAELAIESLIARNALALRVAINGALASRAADPCAAAVRSLSVSPGVAQQFRVRDANSRPICTVGRFGPEREALRVAPGAIRIWVSPQELVQYRVGVVDGMATGALSASDIRQAALDATGGIYGLTVSDGSNELSVIHCRPGEINMPATGPIRPAAASCGCER